MDLESAVVVFAPGTASFRPCKKLPSPLATLCRIAISKDLCDTAENALDYYSPFIEEPLGNIAAIAVALTPTPQRG